MRKLLAPILLIASVAGAFALFAWSPWSSEDRRRELEWLQAYAAWEGELGTTSSDECAASLSANVGPPPTKRLRVVADIAAEACAAPGDGEHRADVGWRVRSSLIASRHAESDATEEPTLAAAVREIQRPLVVSCWGAEDWTPLEEEVAAVDREEFRLAGLADPPRRRIHLAPTVCEPLRRFFAGSYQPYLNEESLLLAEALITLAHEAEHVRVPAASEAEVECYALQRVRGLVLARGRSGGYANELALLGFDIAYPTDPAEYRTDACRAGGPLDLHPARSAWP